MPPQSHASDFRFILSQADGRPMYLQIMEQIEQRIAVGDWPPGTKLPSIRELAAAIRVSVITVKRAYLELERSGAIVTQQGKGSWVNEGGDPDRLQQEELERTLERAADLARAMGLSAAELEARLARYMRPGKSETGRLENTATASRRR